VVSVGGCSVVEQLTLLLAKVPNAEPFPEQFVYEWPADENFDSRAVITKLVAITVTGWDC
jgi:hypothetical protein